MKSKTMTNASMCSLGIALVFHICGILLENIYVLYLGLGMSIIFIITYLRSEKV